ncbi:hypothetical protein ACSX1C_00825 [Pseudomonas sp. MBLB4123]|uniref:hypothetical protein n=1 Tax=Pseudomonas sp. MBLB4123 TaxID=3451557 RepID=UPI003F74EBEB
MDLTLISGLPPECRDIRTEIAPLRFKEALLLEAYRDRKEGRNNGGVKEHLIACKSCLNWLGQQVEERFFLRAKRAAEYCCLSMYMAAEETAPGKEVITGVVMEKVRFSLWRGEDPVWSIGTKGCHILHCPWCGKRLPNKPFSTRTPNIGIDWLEPENS